MFLFSAFNNAFIGTAATNKTVTGNSGIVDVGLKLGVAVGEVVARARVAWHTKYCLQQEYGEESEVSTQDLAQPRGIATKYGLLDFSCENVRSVNGNLRIIDAGIAPNGLVGLWKTADSINQKLPLSLRRAIRKSRLLTSVKQK